MTPAEAVAELDRLRKAADALLKQLVDRAPAGTTLITEVRNRLHVAATLLDCAATDTAEQGLYAQPEQPWDWQDDLERLDQPLVGV